MKERKRYRYNRVTPEIAKEMNKLKASGLTQKKIAKKFNISTSTVQYWTVPKTREYALKKIREYSAKLTPKQRKEKTKKRYEYLKKYIVERYNNDEDFRRKYIKNVKGSFERRQKKRISEGNCNKCGRKREDKRWKTYEI